jgi:Flp pilus assembly protein TadD
MTRAREDSQRANQGRSLTPDLGGTWRVWMLGVFIALLIVAAYWQVRSCGFVNLDDDAYVEFQPMVNQGFHPAAVAWAFAGSHGGLWFPLTSLSHILDCELFGVHAGPMHVESLLWHMANALLVFGVWRALTGATWRAALVAGLFALHPLNVESVAWIAERKNVLSTFFWLLGLGAYVRYVRRPSLGRYFLVLLSLLLALLSKPMAVTFPCTLLLLDFWPLRRWPAENWRGLLHEKLPLFALVVLHGVATILVQQSAGAADYGRRFALLARLGNALISYLRYLGKAAWPETLAPFYAHPGFWPAWAIGGALVALAGLSALAWRQRQTRPWLAFGWLWFLGTLVPVVGLIQVGAQAMADRYTYVPLLGIFTIVAWTGAEMAERWPRARVGIMLAAAASLLACFTLTRRQVLAWTTSTSLYEHSIAVGEDNVHIRYLLGMAELSAGKPEAEVVAQLRRALQLDPTNINTLTQLAILALKHQRYEEARQLIEETRRLEPQNPSVHQSLGSLCLYQDKNDEAVSHFTDALRLNPNNAEAHQALASVFLKQNRLEEARSHLEAAVRAMPWNAVAVCDLGILCANLRRDDEARAYLKRAIWLRPDYQRARDSLGAVEQLSKTKT